MNYHKTSFSKYKGIMDSEDGPIQDAIMDFVELGKVEEARWPVFWDAIKHHITRIGEEKRKTQSRATSESEIDIIDDPMYVPTPFLATLILLILTNWTMKLATYALTVMNHFPYRPSW